ncbi:hypothetical protein Tco_0813239, partial [Tanacetum coccineum]
MITPIEKRNDNKFFEFHGEVGHNTDECMHLRKHIEEMLKAGKLSHLVKEIKKTTERSNLRNYAEFLSYQKSSFLPLWEMKLDRRSMIIEAQAFSMKLLSEHRHVSRTNGKKRAYCISGGSKRNGKCIVLIIRTGSSQITDIFVSERLTGGVNYMPMEKLVLALIHASKCLKRKATKWSIELGEYAIHYRPRVSVKRQILADFIVERPEEESPDTLIGEEEELPEPWILFTDGSSCTDGSGAEL